MPERLPSSSRPRPKQGRKLEEAEEEADGAAAWLRLAEQKRSWAQDRRKNAHVLPSDAAAEKPAAAAAAGLSVGRLPSSSRPRPKQGRKLEEAEEEADGAAAWLRLAEQKRSWAQDRRKNAHVLPSDAAAEKPAALSPSLLQPQQQQQGCRWSADASRGRAEEHSSRPRPKQGRKLEEAEEEADGAAAWLRLAEQKRSRAQDRRKSAHVPPSEEKPAASSPSLLQPQQQQQGRRWSADAGRGRAEEQGPTTASRMVSPRSMKRPITQATRPAASQGDGAGSVRNASFPGEVDEKNVHVVNSSQNKATEAGVLAEWLRTEGDTAAFKVDMGDFGRPITRAGVMAAWRAQQGEHLVFSATHKSVQVGHIELLTSNVDPSQAWCHWAGTTRFSLLAYVYVIPFFRSKKVGTAMVRKVCNYAFSECRALKVLLLIQETNEPLARFYKRIGFSDTGQCFYRGDEKTLLLELTSALEGT
ncbi:hypothetical protein DIPPA_07634 [Diplonema papillatum]|nr:hypothetical protein DIPPA_07634 [Diplonema papillatum]